MIAAIRAIRYGLTVRLNEHGAIVLTALFPLLVTRRHAVWLGLDSCRQTCSTQRAYLCTISQG